MILSKEIPGCSVRYLDIFHEKSANALHSSTSLKKKLHMGTIVLKGQYVFHYHFWN